MQQSARMTIQILTVLAITFSVLPALAAATDPAHGRWMTENKRAVVSIAPCGAQTCGHIMWVANPYDSNGDPKLDANGDPFCGLQLIGELQRSEKGIWDDGWIYNPRSGETYSVEIELLSESDLKVRGYLGLPLLGRSQVWTRAPADLTDCREG